MHKNRLRDVCYDDEIRTIARRLEVLTLHRGVPWMLQRSLLKQTPLNQYDVLHPIPDLPVKLEFRECNLHETLRLPYIPSLKVSPLKPTDSVKA